MVTQRSTGGRAITPSPGVVFRRVGDEAVLVPVQGAQATEGELFALNEVGAFAWERLGEGLGPEAIVQKIVETFEVGPDQARSDLERFLEELESSGCLEPAP